MGGDLFYRASQLLYRDSESKTSTKLARSLTSFKLKVVYFYYADSEFLAKRSWSPSTIIYSSLYQTTKGKFNYQPGEDLALIYQDSESKTTIKLADH